ncbi:MAG: c-type cytochrome, partial [Flavobacteriales bacterium]
MKNYFSLLIFMIVALVMQSCFNPAKPNYQFFPNMYEPVGYETYADSDAFANGIEAQIPVDGTVARGWEPYDYADTNEGYEDAKQNLLSRIEKTPEHLAE